MTNSVVILLVGPDNLTELPFSILFCLTRLTSAGFFVLPYNQSRTKKNVWSLKPCVPVLWHRKIMSHLYTQSSDWLIPLSTMSSPCLHTSLFHLPSFTSYCPGSNLSHRLAALLSHPTHFFLSIHHLLSPSVFLSHTLCLSRRQEKGRMGENERKQGKENSAIITL